VVAPATGAPVAAARAVTPGLELTTGPALLERIRKSSARCTLVNVWASWCGSCKQEFPMLTGFARDFADEGVAVLFVSVDEVGDQPKALEFLKHESAPLPGLIVEGALGAFKQALNPRWKGMIPASFLFDPAGKLRYYWGGPVFENELLPVVQGFLAGEHIDGEANLGIAPGRIDR
jgi:peroxiredoxin